MKKRVSIAMVFGLLALSVSVQATGSDEVSKRKALSAQAFPDQKTNVYVDVPAADNAISNAIVRAFIGSSKATSQIADIMAQGARSPVYLVVGGENDANAYAAVAKALDTFKGQSLPQLHLALIDDPQQAEQLRLAVEALGAEYRVLPPPPPGD